MDDISLGHFLGLKPTNQWPPVASQKIAQVPYENWPAKLPWMGFCLPPATRYALASAPALGSSRFWTCPPGMNLYLDNYHFPLSSQAQSGPLTCPPPLALPSPPWFAILDRAVGSFN